MQTGMGARLSAVSSTCSWAGATMTSRKATKPLGGGTSRNPENADQGEADELDLDPDSDEADNFAECYE